MRMRRSSWAITGALAVLLSSALAGAQARICPAAEHLPQLTIDKIQDPAVPVVDPWQVFFGTVPLSDLQLAQLAGDDGLIDRSRLEMQTRGTWVYVGTLAAAAGTALSSLGWVLFGAGDQPATLSLPLALGGIALGAIGMLTITEAIQRPLEPLLAPTPEHRLTYDEARRLVARVNQRLYRDICEAAMAASGPRADPSSAKVAEQ